MRLPLSPRWVVAHVVVVVLAVVFVNLGLWQLGRLQERRLENAVGEARYESPPLDIDQVVPAAGEDVESLQYRRVTATGQFQPADEVLIRSQVHQGVAGFHVITPLLAEEGAAILVNRGWVPLGMDEVPVTGAPPAPGTVTVEGWLRPGQIRPALGPRDPDEGRLAVLSRVDIDRMGDQVPYELAPVYLVLIGDSGGGELPVPAPEPVFDDQGPHLGYAIQWFSFAAIGVVGYVMLIRRHSKRTS